MTLNAAFDSTKFRIISLGVVFSAGQEDVYPVYGGFLAASIVLANTLATLSCLQMSLSWLETAESLQMFKRLEYKHLVNKFKVFVRVITGMFLAVCLFTLPFKQFAVISVAFPLLLILYILLVFVGQRALIQTLQNIPSAVEAVSGRAIKLVKYSSRAHLVLLTYIILVFPVVLAISALLDELVPVGKFNFVYPLRDSLYFAVCLLLSVNTVYCSFLFEAIIKNQHGRREGEVENKVSLEKEASGVKEASSFI